MMIENDETKPHYQIDDTKNIDLSTERKSATFHVETLTQLMFGGPGNPFELHARRRIS